MRGLEVSGDGLSHLLRRQNVYLRPRGLALGLFFTLSPILLGFSPGGSHTGALETSGRRETNGSARREAAQHWTLPDPSALKLRSSSALVVDAWTQEVLYSQNPDAVTSIASITKLMTAVVVLDAELPLSEPIRVEDSDVDALKNSSSRLPVGWTLPRGQLLNLALMSSDNRAAAALARTFPGGTAAFVTAMNMKAAALGMQHSRFADSSGLNPENVSTARDLATLLRTAGKYGSIRQMTTSDQVPFMSLNTGHVKVFGNSNGLIRDPRWQIGLSKTGYTAEAGHCLVMEAAVLDRPLDMVFLDSVGKYSRIGDAQRLRRWLESGAHAPSR